MREFLDLAGNPLFVKHVRSRLRRSALLPGALIVAFLSLCIVFINYQAKGQNDPEPYVGSQLMFWMQGIILVILGGSQVASSITQMKESGIIDFHRITPIPPGVQTVGIMLGAPIRELLLYAVTLPFALFLALEGPVGATNFAKLLLVQMGSALMYYSLAMITGLTATKARGASGRFVAIMALLNISAWGCFAAGVYGPTLITTTPVYLEVFVDNAEARAEKQRAVQQQRAWQQQQQVQQPQGGRPKQVNPPPPQQPPPPAEPEREVTFYGVPLPIVLQSLMFQGSILTFLFIAASRRIHSARLSLYRKPTALLFLLTLSLLSLGSLWDSPTLFLTLGAVYFLTFAALVLTNTVTPPLGEVSKGIQRARKLTEMRVPIWSDLSANKYVVGAFALVIGLTVGIGLLIAPQPNFFKGIPIQHIFTPWPSLLVGVLTVLTYGFASQHCAIAFGKRAKSFFVLFIFFAWIVPLIIGMLAYSSRFWEGTYFLAVSPLAGIILGGTCEIPQIDELTIKIVSIAPVAISSVFFFFMLLASERRLVDDVVNEHSRRKRKRQSRDVDYEMDADKDDESPRRSTRRDTQ